METVSVIIPTYNERDNILPLIAAIHEQLAAYRHELVVIDDASPDGTYKAVKALNDPSISVITRTGQRGLADAIKCGIEHSAGSGIVIMDADFTHHPRYLPEMIRLLERYDCVAASRFLSRPRSHASVHLFLSSVFDRCIRTVLRSNLVDHLFGYVALRRSVLDGCSLEKIFFGYGDYYVRLLLFLQKNRHFITQIPIGAEKRRYGKSKSNYCKLFFQYSMSVVALACNDRIIRHV